MMQICGVDTVHRRVRTEAPHAERHLGRRGQACVRETGAPCADEGVDIAEYLALFDQRCWLARGV